MRIDWSKMKFAIADPPYLGRANRWYGETGCGDGYGLGKADTHPEAYLWDNPDTHKNLIQTLFNDYDGFAIALTVHSLSTYMEEIKTNSRNGIRVMAWIKPSAVPSGNRIQNVWEPVIIKMPQSRKNYKAGKSCKDVLTAHPPRNGFVGAKPIEWTNWVMDAMGVQGGDTVDDLFIGSGMVSEAITSRTLTTRDNSIRFGVM
jgi:hypothetical protein